MPVHAWNRLDLKDQVFGRLTVLKSAPKNKFGQTQWLCRCTCGKRKITGTSQLRNGVVKSCGCFRREAGKARTAPGGAMHVRKHGMHSTPEYATWRAMIARCTNPHSKDFPRYGGRGIEMCERWRLSFEDFFADMGPRPPATSIERINNRGDYEPGNCKWATRSEQQRNTSRNHLVTLRGKTMPLAAWAEELGLLWATLASRLKYGWSEEKILTTPVRKYA